ncbi:MAG: hypothetical protein JXA16_15760 [Bacteroidales bacterium]|nr:hypothetical protein [Bacteroidales bacterium]
MEILLSAIIGGLITWVFSHIYYKKSSKEIPEWAKPIIAKLPVSKPTSGELLQLFQEALNTGDVSIDPLFGNVACPKCNAPLKELEEKNYGDDNYTIVVKNCPYCGWNRQADVS